MEDASSYISKGHQLLSEGKYTQAIEYFQAAIDSLESLNEAYLGVAEALFAIGKTEQGKVSLFKAMTFDPNNPHGLSLIQKLFFQKAAIMPASTPNSSGSIDPVIAVNTHPNLGKNHYVAELQSGNKLYFRVGSKGCTIVCPENECWDGYEEPKGDLIIPESFMVGNKSYKVTNIGELAFYANEALTSIILPKSIQRIEESAFGETMITEISLPDNLQYIAESAFSMTLLEEVTIPSSVRTIGNDCFEGCSRLTNVLLKNGLVQIGSHAFGDTQIHEIHIPASVKAIGYSPFPKDTIIYLHCNPPKESFGMDDYVLFVPKDKEYLYEEDDDWMDVKINTF